MYKHTKKYEAKKRASDPDWVKRNNKRLKEWRQKNPIKYSFSVYKRNARDWDREFSLSEDLFAHLVTQSCVYCGAEPAPINGIDRVNSSLGYVLGNVVTACKRCNQAKNDMTLDQFKDLIEKIYKRIKNGNCY